jgi:hypothetical protein
MLINPNNGVPAARTAPTAPPTPAQGDDSGSSEHLQLADKLVQGLVDSPEFTKNTFKQLGQGKAVTINVGGEDLIKVSSEGPSFTDRLGDTLKVSGHAIADIATDFIEQDPAFAFRVAADTIKPRVLADAGSDVVAKLDTAWMPIMRGAALAFDTSKAVKNFKDPSISNIDKGIQIAHVGTDAVGLVGTLSYNFIPALKPDAAALTAVGFAGDLAAYAVSLTEYAQHISHGSSSPVTPGGTPVDGGTPPTPVDNNPKTLNA